MTGSAVNAQARVPDAASPLKTRIEPAGCFAAAWRLLRGRYWVFLGITVVGVLLGGMVPLGIMLGPMMCGIYLCLLAAMRGEPVDLGRLFKGMDFFLPSLLATLLMTGLMFLLVIPLYAVFLAAFFLFAGGLASGSVPAVGAGLLLAVLCVGSFVLFTVISWMFTFTYPLIVDRQLQPWPAIKTSVKAFWMNLGGMLGLALLSILLSLVGLMVFYVGAYLVMPLCYAATAVAYRKVFPEIVPTPPPVP